MELLTGLRPRWLPDGFEAVAGGDGSSDSPAAVVASFDVGTGVGRARSEEVLLTLRFWGLDRVHDHLSLTVIADAGDRFQTYERAGIRSLHQLGHRRVLLDPTSLDGLLVAHFEERGTWCMVDAQGVSPEDLLHFIDELTPG